MKKFFLIILLSFAAQLCSAQKIFRFDEGELQFIHSQYGLIIKKAGEYFEVDLSSNLDFKFDGTSNALKYRLAKISEETYNSYLLKNEKVYKASDIKKASVSELRKSMFEGSEDDDPEKPLFYTLNNQIFVHRRNEGRPNGIGHTESVHPYFIIDFGKSKRVVVFDEGFIFNHRKELKLLFSHNDLKWTAKMYRELTPAELSTGHFSGVGQLYKIDSVPDKKVALINGYQENVLNRTFDSIITNRDFVVGYNKGKIYMYSYQFREFPLKNVRAVKLIKYFPKAEILQGNQVKEINLKGLPNKVGDGPMFVDLSFQFPSQSGQIEVYQKDGSFYLKSNGISFSLPNNRDFEWSGDDKLYHTADFADMEFNGDGQFITTYTESGYSKKYPFLIYAKLKSGKFNLYTVDYLLNENPDAAAIKENDALPKNLDSITSIDQDLYLIEKNGFCTYYPIVPEIKYRSVEPFKGHFARFELANGRKGWVDADGNEYLDQ
ncbi:MAG TPA: hypothetical protein VGB44_03600 [Flavobacterium sp.]